MANKIPYPDFWLDKPYYSLNAYLRKQYGQKVYKLSLDASLSCPNRDGTLDTRGCIFCSSGGSGDFSIKIASPSTGLFPEAFSLMEQAFSKHPCSPFIGYFQAFTNTYGDIRYLEEIYSATLKLPQIIGISIGTRPDCISQEILDLLQQLRLQYPDKFIWVELGLQTMHEDTALYIRRGYDLSCFQERYELLSGHDIPVIIHIILGLPGESTEKILQTIQYISTLHPFGVKLQLLHVLEHTDLAEDFRQEKFRVLSLEEYISLLSRCICYLSPDIVIHRVTGDGPKNITLAPKWSFDKKRVLNTLHKYLRDNALFQGCLNMDGNLMECD